MAERNFKTEKTVWSRPGQNDISLYRNQQAIIYSKPTVESDFLQVGNDEWRYACRNLSSVGFKMYMEYCSNKDGYEEALSQAVICKRTGIKKASFYNARDELEQKGYLTLHKADGKTLMYDCWHFYTHPSHNPDFEWKEEQEDI